MKQILLLVIFTQFLFVPSLLHFAGVEVNLIQIQMSAEEESKTVNVSVFEEKVEINSYRFTKFSLLSDSFLSKLFGDRQLLLSQDSFLTVPTPPPNFG